MQSNEIKSINTLRQASEQICQMEVFHSYELNPDHEIAGWSDFNTKRQILPKRKQFSSCTGKVIVSQKINLKTPIAFVRPKRLKKFQNQSNSIEKSLKDIKTPKISSRNCLQRSLIQITPKLKNVMLSLNRAKIEKMKEKCKKRFFSWNRTPIEHSIIINSVSPYQDFPSPVKNRLNQRKIIISTAKLIKNLKTPI